MTHMVKKIGKKKMMDNMKDFKIFEGTLISRFEIGKRYKYDDLPKSIQKEIDVQFDGGYDPEDDIENYEWEFKYLKPEDTIEFLENSFGEYGLDDAVNHPYMKRLIKNIKENGVRKPAVGDEGSHRALACYELGIDLPYLEPHFIEPIDEE